MSSNNTPPASPTAEVIGDENGLLTVSGTGTPGSTITVTYPSGNTDTTTVDEDGNYSITSTTPELNGEVSVVENFNGQDSQPTQIDYTNTTPPAAPTVEATGDENGLLTVTGTGIPGSTITVTYPSGKSDTTTVDEDGNYSITSTTPELNGEVSVVENFNGQDSQPTQIDYTNTTPPAAPTVEATGDENGLLTITGTGIPGSTITVTYPSGKSDTTTVDEDGNYSITSTTPELNGEVSVVETFNGQDSQPTQIDYTNTTPPASPTVEATGDENGLLTITGTGIPGSTITVTYPSGKSDTTTVDEDGNYSITSTTPELNGEVSVVENFNGQDSQPTQIDYTNTTPPASPTVEATGDENGLLTVTGTGIPGSTITVTYPSGKSDTTTVDEDGNYSITSTTPELNGEVSVIETFNGQDSLPAHIDYSDAAPSTTVTIDTYYGADTTPEITGTLSATLGEGETLRVTINDVTYVAGDGFLSVDGTSWTLTIPDGDALNVGSASDAPYLITAVVTDGDDRSGPTAISTATIGMVIINDAPDYMYETSHTPGITGTAHLGSGDTLDIIIRDQQGNVISRFDSVSVNPETGSWNVPAGSFTLDPGNYSVEAAVNTADGSGGQTQSTIRTINVQDTPEPTVLMMSTGPGIDLAAPSVTTLSDGNYLVVFNAGNAPPGSTVAYDLMAQKYSPNGVAIGEPIMLQSSTESDLPGSWAIGYFDLAGGALTNMKHVVANDDGGFAVFTNYTGIGYSYVGFQLYDADGNETAHTVLNMSGNAGPVGVADSGFTLGEQLLQLEDGSYVALYVQGSGYNFGIAYETFSSTGEALGNTALVLNTTGSNGYGQWGTLLSIEGQTSAFDTNGMTAALVGGHEASESQFAVAYMSDQAGGVAEGTADPANYQIYLRLADANADSGTNGADKSLIHVNQTTTAFESISPNVVTLKEGGVAVVWASNAFDTEGNPATTSKLSNFQLYHQTFDWDGTQWVAQTTTDQRIATTNKGGYVGVTASAANQEFAAVGLEQGGYVVVWSQATTVDGDPSNLVSNLYSQEFDAAGNSIGKVSLVSSTTSDQNNYSPSVTALADGGYAVSWVTNDKPLLLTGTGFYTDGSIMTTVYNADGTVRSAFDTDHPMTADYRAATQDGEVISEAHLIESGGVHTLSDGGHVNVTLEGAANDFNTVVLHNTDFAFIDGGAHGHNTLSLGMEITGNVTLNTNNIHNINDLNLGDHGVEITLTTNDVLNMTPGKILTIEGGDSSSLTLGSGVGSGDADGWQADGLVQYQGSTYNVYTSNEDPTAHVWVQSNTVVVH